MEKLPISLLPQIRKATCDALHKAGIYTLEQFADLSVEELQQFKGIKSSATMLRANAIAFVNDCPIWVNPMPESLYEGGWMMDLETLQLGGERNTVWCLGWGNDHGESWVAVVAPNQPAREEEITDGQTIQIVPDSDTAWERFYDMVMVDNRPIYHWTGYDTGIMRQSAPYNISVDLVERMHDLHRSFINTVRLPQKSYSIKPVAEYFGFRWSGHKDWRQAETDYHTWLGSGHVAHLAAACGYQRDDVLALTTVWRWLIDNDPA